MRKAQINGGNSNLLSPIPAAQEPIIDTSTDNREFCGNPRAGLYLECIGCPDFPRHCNGPKLAASVTITA